MTTSRPARRAGIDSDWTSFGEVIFCRVSDARTRALTPASANVCNEAPRCLSFLLYLPRSTGSVLGQEERTRAGDARTRRSNVTRSERASIVCGYSRLARPDVGAADLAIDAGRALGRVNLEIDVCKACRRQRGSVVIDRDRARDASRPSVQRLLDLRVERLELHHIGNREPASRPKHPERLFDHSALVLGQVDHAVRDDDIDRSVRQWHILDRPLQEGCVRDARALHVAIRQVEHLIRHVDAVRVATGRYTPRREQYVETRARSEVEHHLAWLELREHRGIAAAETHRLA